MAKKRFTDAEIWRKKWFRKLPSKGKLLWKYLKDTCDVAGVIDFDEVIASAFIGEDVTKEDALNLFGHRVIELEEDKLLLSGFVDFQYKKLSLVSKPHKPVIQRLQELGFEFDFDSYSVTNPKGLEGVKIEIYNPSQRLEEKEKEKEQEEVKEEYQYQNQDQEMPNVSNHLFDDIVNEFNATLAGTGKLKHYKLPSDKDKRSFADLMRKQPELRNIEMWKELFELIKSRKKLIGTHPTFNRLASLGWLFTEGSASDIINGKYENDHEQITAKTIVKLGTGEGLTIDEIPEKVLQCVRSYGRGGYDKAKNFLGPVIWISLENVTTWVNLCEGNEYQFNSITASIKKDLMRNGQVADQ